MPPPSPAPDSKRLRAGCRLARLCGTIWRETGAKRGDFPLQTATIGARSERVDTENQSLTPRACPCQDWVGYGLMVPLSPSPLSDDARRCIWRGAEGSNPSPSSKESAANLTSFIRAPKILPGVGEAR